MKRFAALVVSALAGVSFSVAAVSAAPGTPPRARLRAFICQAALKPARRSISIEAMMRPVPHTRKMAIRFDLLSRTKPGGTYSAVRGGDLGAWLTPEGQPNLGQRAGDVWSISHPVTGLPAPATYRYRVVFRWSADHGHVLATRTLMTSRCFEPELRPDLLVASVAIGPVPNRPKQAYYTAAVRNAGATAAGPFELDFTPGGSAITRVRTIQRLEARAEHRETFIGPACAALTAPTFSVDPTHQIDDSNPANNTLTVPSTCPALTTR